MIITTTPTIEGHHIKEYLGIVSAADTYVVGGVIGEGFLNQNKQYNPTIERINMQLDIEATKLHADAVVGLQVSVTSVAGDIVVTVTGTAVKIEKAGWDDELPDL